MTDKHFPSEQREIVVCCQGGETTAACLTCDRAVVVRPPTERELHDIRLDLEVLDRIEQVQDSGEHDGKCPNWIIPGRIPVQRLQGLKRRGLLDYNDGYWWLTELGIARQRALSGFGDTRK